MKIWIAAPLILLLISAIIYDNMAWDFDGKVRENLTTMFGTSIQTSAVPMALIFLLESIYRLIGFAFMCNWKKIDKITTWKISIKLFFIRMLGAIANVIGCLGASFSGGVMFAVIKQCRIPVIAGLRVIFLNDFPDSDDIYQLSTILLGAIAFCVIDFQTMGSMMGISFCAVNALIRSGYYVLTEAYIKKDLKNTKMADKQVITAFMDVFAYACTIWIEIVTLGRTWNPCHGLFAHWSYVPCSFTNCFASAMWIVVMQNYSATMVAIINVLGLGLTWVFKLTIKAEEFNAAKLVLIFLIGVAVMAYTQMKERKKEQILEEMDKEVTIELEKHETGC